MSIGSGIAVCGIWGAVACTGVVSPIFVAVVAFFAVIATMLVVAFSDNRE